MPSEREHVTPYIYNNPEKFKIFNFRNEIDLSKYRWAVDEEEDLSFVKEIISKIEKEPILIQDILEVIKKEPKIFQINFGVNRNSGNEKSEKRRHRIS